MTPPEAEILAMRAEYVSAALSGVVGQACGCDRLFAIGNYEAGLLAFERMVIFVREAAGEAKLMRAALAGDAIGEAAAKEWRANQGSSGKTARAA